MDGTGSGVMNRIRIGNHTASDARQIASRMHCTHTPRTTGVPGDLHADRPRFLIATVAVTGMHGRSPSVAALRLVDVRPRTGANRHRLKGGRQTGLSTVERDEYRASHGQSSKEDTVSWQGGGARATDEVTPLALDAYLVAHGWRKGNPSATRAMYVHFAVTREPRSSLPEQPRSPIPSSDSGAARISSDALV